MKGKIDNNTIIVWDFNTPLSMMDRSARQEINKETLDLNYALDEMDLTDIYRIFHQQLKNTHSSQVHMEHFP